MSLRQLATAAGVSNPYLSQIERGLRRPSADVLQQIARGLSISATALYTRAGLLDQADQADQPDQADRPDHGTSTNETSNSSSTSPPPERSSTHAVIDAIAGDPQLDPAQRRALIDVYSAFVRDDRLIQEQS